jgi:two-component system, OmpR family, sensor kinase
LDESRLFKALQEFMELPALEVDETFTQAAQRIAEALSCDKVDIFLFDESKQTLAAIGTSMTPMGRLQRKLGLDRLPLANGGSVVRVFKNGGSELQSDSQADPEELRGFLVELGVRSTLAVTFDVNGVRRGVLSTMSAKPDFFQPADQQFVHVMARCMGVLVQRAEMVEAARRVEAEQGRRAGADEIITVLAHDFRNHLQPLVGRLQLMSLYTATGKAVSSSDVDSAVRAAHRLTKLTDDLLDLRRLDEGLFTLNLQAVNLSRLAQETATAFSNQSHQIQVEGETDLMVIADVDRTRQVLDNLVANAIKHSPTGTPIELRVLLQRGRSQDEAIIEVTDRGLGITPEILPTLFERYVAGASSHGIGLGLHLVRHIARLHGGDVQVHSKLGEGTTFRVVMPLEAACQSTRRGISAE